MSDLCVGLIGGTGLGQALGADGGRRHEVETPFGRPSDAVVEGEWAGVRVMMLSRHGPGHLLNPTQVPYRANVFALKQLGCTHVLASGAVGSLREEFKPKQLVIPNQLIDRTTRRAGTFFEKTAVHVEFAEPFCPILRQILLESSPQRKLGVSAEGKTHSDVHNPTLPGGANASDGSASDAMVHDGGCYVAMEGSAFSTRAESLMHRLWGGDLIGMTAMPEAKLAREAELPYALVALVTDYDCWRQKPPVGGGKEEQQKVDPHVLLKEIQGNLEAATANAVQLIRRAVEMMGQKRELLATCPARNALELAIWSDKSRIDAEEKSKLAPLWGRYLG